MISFAALGSYGRLGNQMFQVAATLSAAKRVGTRAHFPRGAQVQNVFELKDCNFVDSINPEYVYFEKSFDFDRSFLSVPDSCNIHGYFQSEKYFSDYEDLIFENFSFKESIRDEADKSLRDMSRPICSIHVRRGDYVNLSDVHQFPGTDYYARSMEEIRKIDQAVKFIVFSDDVKWCSGLDIFSRCQFSDENIDSVEMCMMSMCDFHIIANSSFSWWGSKLSKSSLTIAPSVWFGLSGPKSWQDIYCKNWKQI